MMTSNNSQQQQQQQQQEQEQQRMAQMTMTEADVDILVAAINSIYSPHSSNADRHAAQTFADKWKLDHRCALMGHRLLAPTHPDHIRYFGLSLLEHCVRYTWSQHSIPDKQQIRELLITVIVQLPLDTPKFIQEKAAHVFTECVERTWPLEWSGLYALLMTLSQTRPMTVCRVLKFIAEDTFLYATTLTSGRKDDLRNCMTVLMAPSPAQYNLNEHSSSQANIIGTAVPMHYYQVCEIPPADVGWMSRLFAGLQQSLSSANEQLAVCTVETIAAYMDWLPLEILIKNKVLENILPLLSSQSKILRMAACETLMLLMMRTYAELEQVDEFLVKPLLSAEAISLIGQAWVNAGGSPLITTTPDDIESHLNDDYPFLKRLATVWVDFCSHLCHKKRETVPDNLRQYLEFSLVLARHPSLFINSITTSLWQMVLRFDVIARLPEMKEFSLAVFTIYAERMNKNSILPSDEDDAPLGCRYSYVDFEDNLSDFQTAAGSFRSQSYTLMKTVVPRHSLFCLNVCLARIRAAIATPFPPSDDSQRSKEDGLLTTTSSYYLEWDTLSAVVHAVVTSLPTHIVKNQCTNDQEKSEQTQAMAMIREMLQLSLEFTCTDPLVIGKQLEGLTAFAEILAAEPNAQALQLLQKVFTMVTFTLPGEVAGQDDIGGKLSGHTIALRRKAAASLLRLAIGIPDILMTIYADIEGEVNRLINAKLVALEDITFLKEFLAAIVHNSTIILLAEKQKYYNVLFEPTAKEAVSERVVSMLSSMPSFLEAIGLKTLAQVAEEKRALSGSVDTTSVLPVTILESLAKCRQNRSYMLQLVVLYRSCINRTSRGITPLEPEAKLAIMNASPWVVHLWKVLPTVFAMIMHLHSLWDGRWWQPDAVTGKALLPMELASVLEMSELEKAAILSVNATEASDREHDRVRNSLECLDLHVHHVQNWLRTFRESLYGLLNLASYLVPGDYFYNAQLAPALLTNVFGSVTSLNNNHWRSLVNFLRPIIVNCPKEHFDSVLKPIVPALATFLGNKLNAEWKQAVDSGLILGTLEEAENTVQSTSDTLDTDSAAAKNEVLSQKILRDVTRGWTDIWAHVLMPPVNLPNVQKEKKGKASGNRLAPDFGAFTDLAMYLLSANEIVEPVLYTMMYSMTWKDTKTCTINARILERLMPLLLQDPKFHSFYGKDVYFAALQAFHDGYHQEGHDQLIGLMTSLYILLRPLSPLPAETLSSLVPSLKTPEAICAFELKLSAEKQPAVQRKIMKDALKEIAGVKPGQWFRNPDGVADNKSGGGGLSSMRKIPDRLLLMKKRAPGPDGWHEAVDGGAHVDLGLLDLFRP